MIYNNLTKQRKQKYIDQIITVYEYKYIQNQYRKDEHILSFIRQYGLHAIFSGKHGKIIKGRHRRNIAFLIDCIKCHCDSNLYFYIDKDNLENLFSKDFVPILKKFYELYMNEKHNLNKYENDRKEIQKELIKTAFKLREDMINEKLTPYLVEQSLNMIREIESNDYCLFPFQKYKEWFIAKLKKEFKKIRKMDIKVDDTDLLMFTRFQYLPAIKQELDESKWYKCW